MIRDTVESIGNAVLDGIGRASSRVQESRPLPADLLESDEAYLAVFDAPGATASDIHVRLDGHTVRARVDRFREFHEGFEMRFPGRGLSLDGQVRLPEGAVLDPDGASATLAKNGTLHVRVPKAEGDDPIRVDAAEEPGRDTNGSADTPSDGTPSGPAGVDADPPTGGPGETAGEGPTEGDDGGDPAGEDGTGDATGQDGTGDATGEDGVGDGEDDEGNDRSA